MVPEHVSEASLADVQAFYDKFYQPNNAVLVVAGKVDTEEVEALVEKWFGHLPSGPIIERILPPEPPQRALQQRILRAQEPADALYFGFHIPSRVDRDYYGVDMLSDILGNGPSSRLYRRLLKEKELFSAIDCYVSGSIDPGLLIIEAKPVDGVTNQEARAAIWEELELLKQEGISTRELEKIKNKVESTLIFSELSVLNKAINLAFFEILGNAELINQEAQLYRRITREELQSLAQHIFTEDNCSEVTYEAALEEAMAEK